MMLNIYRREVINEVKYIDKNKKNLDILTKYGYILKYFTGMKKPISEVKKREQWLYHFYMNKEVHKELRKRYKGNDKKVISRIKILIIEEKYGLEIPDYMLIILMNRGELNG